MSKPALRIVLALLISLGVILAIAATVPDRLGINSVTQLTGIHEQTSVGGRVSLTSRTDASSYTPLESVDPRSGHDCGSSSASSADD